MGKRLSVLLKELASTITPHHTHKRRGAHAPRVGTNGAVLAAGD